MKSSHHRFMAAELSVIGAVFAFGFGLISPAKANTVSLIATSDTYITEHENLGGPTSIHGSDDRLWLARGTGIFREIPLIRFDLTAYEKKIVSSSTAELRLELISGHGNNPLPSQSVSIREALVSWDENTANFATFGGTGYNEATQTGPNIMTRDVIYTGVEESILFTIPSSIVQEWIDDPVTNYGLILISNTTINQTDLIFSSREGLVAPSLSFDIAPIPVPSAFMLFGSGVLALFGVRTYKSKPSN